MHIYFVRHGETVANNTNIHQDERDPLSEIGRKQSRYLATSLKRFPIALIVASPFERTRETAEIIKKEIGKPVQYSPLLREILWPSEIRGLKFTDPESIRVRELITTHATNPDWHYSDEENFSDSCQRAQELLDFFNTLPHECILAVTHGRFLRVIMAVMLYGRELTVDHFMPITRFFETTNTGITIVEKNSVGYELLTWNDYAHLKEIMD